MYGIATLMTVFSKAVRSSVTPNAMMMIQSRNPGWKSSSSWLDAALLGSSSGSLLGAAVTFSEDRPGSTVSASGVGVLLVPGGRVPPSAFMWDGCHGIVCP